jgi:hypothetical protein
MVALRCIAASIRGFQLISRQAAGRRRYNKWKLVMNLTDLFIPLGADQNWFHDQYHWLRKQVRASWTTPATWPAILPLMFYTRTMVPVVIGGKTYAINDLFQGLVKSKMVTPAAWAWQARRPSSAVCRALMPQCV